MPAPCIMSQRMGNRTAAYGTSSSLRAGRRLARMGRCQVSVVSGEARSSNRTAWQEKDNLRLNGSNGSSTATATLTAPAPATSTSVASSTSVSIAARLDDVNTLVWAAASDLQPQFTQIDRMIASNLQKVQKAFKDNRVGPHHFAGSTGYGHGDLGREVLDQVLAQCMGAEAGLMRSQFFSGTHAIASALYAVLRPGDEMLAVAGHPYDTLEEVIGLRGTAGHGSLMEWGITYRELPLAEAGHIDWEALSKAIVPGRTKVAHIQRSCGYALRPTLSIEDIRKAVQIVKAQDPNCLVLVDNCYGEFTAELEPCDVGADLAMGSLIKNPGGTIAAGGGYVVGRADLIGRVGARLAAPGIGTDAGQVSGETLRIMYQGLFLAPQTVGEAIKGGRLVAEVLSREGLEVIPAPGWQGAASMITAIRMGTKERMLAFCKAVQRGSPVGSYIRPEPGVTAGYGDEVIFADGTFIDGSTAEISADGPIRPPYVVYCQGGTHWTHWSFILESIVTELRGSQAQGQ